MIAVPCAFMRVSTANNRSISRFSSAAVGSSRMKTRHWRRSALAIATNWRSAKPSEATGRSGSGSKSSWASTARAAARICARSTRASGPNRRTGRSPSAMFSAIDSAGTRRSSCGMVTMPAAMASRGLAKCRAAPSTRTVPRSGRQTPPRMRISVDLPAPFSPTTAWISAGADVEVDAVEGDRRAEMFAHALSAGGRVAHRHQRGTNATCIFSSVNLPRSMMTSLSSATVQSRMGTS